MVHREVLGCRLYNTNEAETKEEQTFCYVNTYEIGVSTNDTVRTSS
jgi:hypothetical protein